MDAKGIRDFAASGGPGVAVAFPRRDDPSVLHVTFEGLGDTPFEGGLYHAELALNGYPAFPPRVTMLWPSGSFQVDVPLCVPGVTHYTPHLWKRDTTLEGLVNTLRVMMASTDLLARRGIGFVQRIDEAEARRLATASRSASCAACGRHPHAENE